MRDQPHSVAVTGKVLSRLLLKEMAAREDVAQARRVRRIRHPIELNLAQARMTDSGGSKVVPRLLRIGARACFQQRIDGDAGRCRG
jgi:hypothetical protein